MADATGEKPVASIPLSFYGKGAHMDPTLNSSFFSIFEFALHSTVISIILIPKAEGGTEMPEIYFEQQLMKIPQITSVNDEKQKLHLLLQEGLTDVVHGNSRPFTEAMDTLRNHRKNKTEVL